MQVVYLGRHSRRTNPLPQIEGDVIELLSNNWDDFGYKTSFPVTCRLNGEIIELPNLHLLIAEEYTSSIALDRLLNDGWDGVFPIPDIDYVSVPTEITFYEQIEGTLGIDVAVNVAKQLRDASYLVHVVDDEAAKTLADSEGFRKSLQRERASTQSFMDGWRVFERKVISVLDLGFQFENVSGSPTTLELKFQPRTRFPHDINVLIGPNGYGKSQLLHKIVQDWISPSDEEEIGFVKKPNLSQLVVISYSPFERFPVDLAGHKLQDKDAYRYFGLRGRTAPSDSNKLGRITLSHGFPKRNAAQSLIQCLADDQRLRFIRDWSRKVATMERVLRTAISFDFAAVEVEPSKHIDSFYRETSSVDPLAFDVSDRSGRRCYIPVGSDRIEELDNEQLADAVKPESGVTFFFEGQPKELSSGQRLFAYIVINILGAIRRNSLILVDEPELFLHPTLEIQFVDMLKTILSRFNSKALLATHSVVTVREIPSQCVHVFEKTDDDIVLKRPPFQTFGGDFQRISSYVFGDKAVSKPFEAWIRDQLDDLGSADALITELGDDINEELIVQIKAMERRQW